MHEARVGDLMVHIDEYATVPENTTLADALVALEQAQERFARNRYRHRAILVTDAAGRVIGKLSQLDVIRSLDPSLEDTTSDAVARLGFDPRFMSAGGEHRLRPGPFANLCRAIAGVRVRDIMTTPGSGELVTEDASLNEAIHQMVRGRHQSLLVSRGDQVVGVLRLSDLFEAVYRGVRACQ